VSLRHNAAATAFLLAGGQGIAAEFDFGIPHPHGWVGTTSQWVQGLGLIFALFNLVLLLVIWRSIGRGGVTTASKALLFGAILVLPIVVVFLATAHGLEQSMRTEACGHCHIMKGHLDDLRNPKSDTLAAVHFKNRYITEYQCYTCHSDYGMGGTVRAKIEGLGHTIRNLTGHYELPLKIAHPYQNVRCLSCHAGATRFLAKHEKEQIPRLMTGKDSCLDCHGPAHPPESKQALR